MGSMFSNGKRQRSTQGYFQDNHENAIQGNTQSSNDASVSNATGNKYICSNGHAHSSREELEFCSEDRHSFMEKGIERHILDLANIEQQRLHEQKMADKRIDLAKLLRGPLEEERERQLKKLKGDLKSECLNKDDTMSTEENTGPSDQRRKSPITEHEKDTMSKSDTSPTEENVEPSDKEGEAKTEPKEDIVN